MTSDDKQEQEGVSTGMLRVAYDELNAAHVHTRATAAVTRDCFKTASLVGSVRQVIVDQDK